VADIFVSYTSDDRNWAFWIGQELLKLGHAPRIHEWEIPAGGNIPRWMGERHQSADHILCVTSNAYLTAPFSSWERQAAEWATASTRPNFALPVRIEACELPTLSAVLKYCDLFGIEEDEARTRLRDSLAPVGKPPGPIRFPGEFKAKTSRSAGSVPVAFPGKASAPASVALSNIPIAVPRHFLGRDQDLAAIDAALSGKQGRVAIAALHGLRGVGKTTLASAYADRHRDAYRATWWIRAEIESTRRADLVDLGVRLGWVAVDAPEESTVAAVLERLRGEGDGILLIYDNANNTEEIRKYLREAGLRGS
jgi:hypothetical protein